MTKYKTIVIDPPWDIGQNYGPIHNKKTLSESRVKFKHVFTEHEAYKNYMRNKKMSYGMMTDDDLRTWEIPVEVNDDAVLFVWCIHQKLPLALELIKLWGFSYKHVLTWHKIPARHRSSAGNLIPVTSIITAGWWRNSELLIYATRGKSIFESSGEPVKFVFAEKMGTHSVKPPGIYQAIKLKTPEPRIDIFARRRHVGFDAWGDQVESELQEVLI